ncbi:MAG: hypothetical protein OMM_06622 [Candidatus Magnetoglobus multicellularis str. Araruama]|uniref:Uncharacterized protein n=1 Tax=Candidatus Magnetoglobus multicellularis str. Araruama TaxID=890399 RepID=A0A1V1PGT4_9BACT|nr:MAG: hypothetical protein OMM_06622 [Candidatus Magnetoglobus multicellularis str. Araruama]
MLGLKLNEDHDIYFDKGQLAIIDAGDYCLQSVKCRCLTNYSEWYMDRSIGVPYTQYIFDKGDIDISRQFFYQQVKGSRGVESFDITVFEVTDRVLKIEFTLNNQKQRLTVGG